MDLSKMQKSTEQHALKKNINNSTLSSDVMRNAECLNKAEEMMKEAVKGGRRTIDQEGLF